MTLNRIRGRLATAATAAALVTSIGLGIAVEQASAALPPEPSTWYQQVQSTLLRQNDATSGMESDGDGEQDPATEAAEGNDAGDVNDANDPGEAEDGDAGNDEANDGIDCVQEGAQDGENAGC